MHDTTREEFEQRPADSDYLNLAPQLDTLLTALYDDPRLGLHDKVAGDLDYETLHTRLSEPANPSVA